MQSETSETIVGTWRLEYFELQAPDGSVTHPYGEQVNGYLVYSPEGIMSAAFMRADRGSEVSQDLAEAETAPAWDAFMAYSGPYQVEGDRIVHDVSCGRVESIAGVAKTIYQARRIRLVPQVHQVVSHGIAPQSC